MKSYMTIKDAEDIITKDYVDSLTDKINISISSKVNKVVGFEGNIPSITNTGDLVDSGIKLSVYNGCLRITYDDGL